MKNKKIFFILYFLLSTVLNISIIYIFWLEINRFESKIKTFTILNDHLQNIVYSFELLEHKLEIVFYSENVKKLEEFREVKAKLLSYLTSLKTSPFNLIEDELMLKGPIDELVKKVEKNLDTSKDQLLEKRKYSEFSASFFNHKNKGDHQYLLDSMNNLQTILKQYLSLSWGEYYQKIKLLCLYLLSLVLLEVLSFFFFMFKKNIFLIK